MIEGISKNEPIETNINGGKQSASPYGMHLIDPKFLMEYYKSKVVHNVAQYMLNPDVHYLLDAISALSDEAGYSEEQVLLKISQVRKEASYKYAPQNWRLIPQEEHINHALCHYLAYRAEDEQDNHLDHCLCRLMFACCTNVSADFTYI